MDFEQTLNLAISLAENECRMMQACYANSFCRTHPTPTRFRQRKDNNFFDAKFSETTPPKDFLVSLNQFVDCKLLKFDAKGFPVGVSNRFHALFSVHAFMTYKRL